MTEYKLIRSRRKTIGISVDAEGQVIVRAPQLSTKAQIEKALRDAEGWIARQRARLQAEAKRAEDAGALSEAEIDALAKSMKAALALKLPAFAARAGVTYGRVTVRCQRSKWGSCSAKGNLNFNCLLMLAPEEVLDYVIVHELCHRKHMDHSKEFWAEVERLCPGFKARKKWLKDNGGTLMRRANG